MTADDIRVLLFAEPDQTFDDATVPTLVFRADPEHGEGWVLYYRDAAGRPRSWFLGGGPTQLEWARGLAGKWRDRIASIEAPAPPESGALETSGAVDADGEAARAGVVDMHE